VTSLGLIYTQQFDTFGEFLRKITGQYKKTVKQKEEDRKPEPPKTPILPSSSNVPIVTPVTRDPKRK
jgi:hypothetical protein